MKSWMDTKHAGKSEQSNMPSTIFERWNREQKLIAGDQAFKQLLIVFHSPFVWSNLGIWEPKRIHTMLYRATDGWYYYQTLATRGAYMGVRTILHGELTRMCGHVRLCTCMPEKTRRSSACCSLWSRHLYIFLSQHVCHMIAWPPMQGNMHVLWVALWHEFPSAE